MLPSIWRNSALLGGPSMDDFVERFFYGLPASQRTQDTVWAPRVDVHETDNDIILDVELPGVDKKDVRVEVNNGVLTISGERKNERKVKEDGYRSVERVYGKFERSFRLGDTVDAEKISAAYRNGIMTVTLPKAEKVKPREIAIEVK